ncbi:MAG: LysM peptidoglycan-binding domain-containing protein [Chloroflexi bacterium]|nr:LysM peptidoglycan-binding domain-containing protein [Chloroflexota bacterium]
MPEVTLSLPVALGLLAVFLVVGALVLFITLKGTGKLPDSTATPSPTETVTITPTPTETSIPTETPTLTPEPPIEYIVKTGDSCISIASLYGSSVSAIVSLNSLNSLCTDLQVGQIIKVPRPTPTPPPAPTATLEPAAATRAACETVAYTVQADDTLSTIATNYGVSIQAIKDWNGLSTDNVYTDTQLTIPLCKRDATPGPSPTPTTPPPYTAPNLLLPADGAPFTLAADTVTLQWASVGALRDNERYQVTIEDATGGTGRKLTQYVTDTKFIVPVTFRPQDNSSHIMRWWVVAVRQTVADDQGNPIWSTAGAASAMRVFGWSGAGPAATPTK